ncbi:Monooxygenase 2 [Sesamum angolense]|uniref:Monooxygenase 2 n=1 Tax=Sesamum angolense TaxID=2727404 RepID=A0AAE1W614_9LAMI|nr:Monooxygenase 2 [Sesamum angolense]
MSHLSTFKTQPLLHPASQSNPTPLPHPIPHLFPIQSLSLTALFLGRMESEIHEDIVIVGAGIAGLSTALGLHRLGIRSMVLESSDGLRITGFALTMWTNAWRALDALGIGDSLRARSLRMQGLEACSRNPSLRSQQQGPDADLKLIVSIEESGRLKLLHLADGTVVRAKVLIGCDGVNSIVAKWLGLQSPVNAGRSAIRGFVEYMDGHGFEPKFHAYFGGGVRYGFIPCDQKSIYWFCTFTPSLFKCKSMVISFKDNTHVVYKRENHPSMFATDDDNEHDPLKMKQFVMSNIWDAPKHVSDIVERTGLDCISCAPLKFRQPWNILQGNIVKNNVCVAGDALHPMTPDIGQGGCSALEDSIILARCLAEALLGKRTCNDKEKDEDYVRMEKGLEKYSRERRWRSFSLISTAYVVGLIQESDSKVISFLRKNILFQFLVGIFGRMADFDCGKLTIS